MVIDAAGPDADLHVSGHVCVITDLRRWTVCRTTGLAGLSVTIGTASALTDDSGDFSIEPPAVAPTHARIFGAAVAPSWYPYDPSAATIDVIAADAGAFADVLSTTPITITDGDGTLLLELLRDGSRTAGMTADSNPPAGSGPYYDAAAADAWETDATELNSKTLIPDLPTGDTQVTASIGADSDAVLFPVHADAITFGTLNVIP